MRPSIVVAVAALVALASCAVLPAPTSGYVTRGDGLSGVRGMILDERGLPVDRAFVDVEFPTGGSALDEMRHVSGQDGSYAFSLKPGSYFLVANKPGIGSRRIPFVTRDGQDTLLWIKLGD